MDEAVLTGLLSGGFGLAGVLAGGFISSRQSRNAELRNARKEARTAARLMEHHLLLWVRAGRILAQARTKPQSISSAAKYRRLLSGVREFLDLSWWELHRERLAPVTSPDEWRVLSNAAHAAGGCLKLLENVGDTSGDGRDDTVEEGLAQGESPVPSAEQQEMERPAAQAPTQSAKAISPHKDSERAKEDSRSLPAVAASEKNKGAGVERAGVDLEFDPETAELLRELEQFQAEFDAELAELNREFDQLQREVAAWDVDFEILDGIAKTVIGARSTFEKAQRVCRGFAEDPGNRRERREAARRRDRWSAPSVTIDENRTVRSRDPRLVDG
ncbi:MAG TPA: hypothetical protein VLA19_05560 [Herpetosiphonaceae bacterium]|nr:hypothetical protein [Herpetosiphonaceae bacterium]